METKEKLIVQKSILTFSLCILCIHIINVQISKSNPQWYSTTLNSFNCLFPLQIHLFCKIVFFNFLFISDTNFYSFSIFNSIILLTVSTLYMYFLFTITFRLHCINSLLLRSSRSFLTVI